MTKRDIIHQVLNGTKPPYVPWSFSFTIEPLNMLQRHFGDIPLETALDNHLLCLGNSVGFFKDLGANQFEDVFGVVWDRCVDKDIGMVVNQLLPEPDINKYSFPNPLDSHFFEDIPEKLHQYPDRFRVFQIGFSLYERAWTLRGMEEIMLDFYLNPGFVHKLFNAIADYNIAQIKEALKYDIDAIYFGDDWGRQQGLQMGIDLWREFIKPVLARMYAEVRSAGKYVFIHSCGDVDELFDELIEIGVNCFNPFQPEVMDVDALVKKYRGKLTFHGGLSTQFTLPYGTIDEVRNATQHLIELGSDGSYILSPAHAVEGDVSLENMLTFIETAQSQPGYQALLTAKCPH